MKYTVTGGAGFIGSNLVDELISRGHEVVVIDNLSSGKKENINPKATFVEADIICCRQGHYPSSVYKQFPCPSRDTLLVEKAIKGSEAIFHLAALARVQPSIDNPVFYNKVNVDGTINLLKIANDAGVKRFVFSASSSAYGETEILPSKESDPIEPLSPYGLQKVIGEQYRKLFSTIYDIETVSLRYFNVFGERMSLDGGYRLVIPIFASQMINGKPMTVRGDGEQKRDFIYVGDVVEANILASTSKKVGNGEVLNIGSGESISINSIASFFGGEVEYVPALLEPKNTLADNSLARNLLDWDPKTPVEQWIPKYKKELGIKA